MTTPIPQFTVYPNSNSPTTFAADMDLWISETEAWTTAANALAAEMGITDITLAAGVETFLFTPTSANLRAALTDETGTGSAVFATSPWLNAPIITNYVETVHAPAAGSSFTVNLANGTLQKLTTNANTTITLPTPSAGKSYTIQVVFGGAHTITWAGGGTIKWSNGAAPTATSVSGKIDTFTFYSVDGTNTMGISGGNNA